MITSADLEFPDLSPFADDVVYTQVYIDTSNFCWSNESKSLQCAELYYKDTEISFYVPFPKETQNSTEYRYRIFGEMVFK